jgi:hypothetical protein
MQNQSTNLTIPQSKFDLNYKFYFMLKYLTKTKLTDTQILQFKEYLNRYGETLLKQKVQFDFRLSKEKEEYLLSILDLIHTQQDLDLLLFVLGLYDTKALLLCDARIKYDLLQQSLKHLKLHPLSTAYDKQSLIVPYGTRVNGALLALLFFEKLEVKDLSFCTEHYIQFFDKLADNASMLSKKGLELNQIFMLMFTESVDQLIKSTSGSDYEKRINSVLVKAGVPSESITKEHDANDKSTEFDFFFTLKGKTIGIGAKRTLRERYKQFIKTAHTSQLDVMICITLGVDATEDKVHTICSQHNVILFVADEIYEARPYLQNETNCYSVKDLTLETLNKLVSDTQ